VLEPIERAGPASAADREALGRLLACQGVLLFRQGHQGLAQEVLERSLALLRPLAVPEALIEPVMVYSLVNCVTGNFALAHQLMDEALSLARVSGDQWFTALCLTNQGVLARFEGRYVEAFERSQAGLSVWRTTGDPRFTAMGANLLSLNAVMLQRYAEAEDLLQESLALNSALGDRWGLGTAYRSLGRLAAMQGDYAQAKTSFSQALEVLTELGAQGDAAQVLADLGWTWLALGDTVQAEGAWLETLRIAVEGEQLPLGLEAVLGLATLRVRSGDNENAFELLLMILDHPASLQETKNRASGLRAGLEAQLTPAQIEAIRARSAEKTFEADVGDLLN
jgi:tetratricopeptide (TPR) repeat protein